MGYVGNQTTTSYSSMDKQVITGDGGTGYTLSHAVANAQEIEVFVNNVRQEPAVAYTVTGTTLTMTGNVASTDDFYVVYQGKAVQTVVPPDGSVTSAKLDTNIAIAGSLSTVGSVGIGTTSPPDHLSVVTSGSNAQLSVDRSDGASGRTVLIHSSTGGHLQTTGSVPLIFGTADTERMRIDTSGRITKPNQPSFTGHLTSNQAMTAYQANILIGFTCPSYGNVGSHFNTSNGRFTAPVTGFYLFTGAVQCNTPNSLHIGFYMNGGAYESDSWIDHGANTLGAEVTRIMYLTTNQYVNLVALPTATSNANANRTRFQGYLLG